jgi:hypothetical protein
VHLLEGQLQFANLGIFEGAVVDLAHLDDPAQTGLAQSPTPASSGQKNITWHRPCQDCEVFSESCRRMSPYTYDYGLR